VKGLGFGPWLMTFGMFGVAATVQPWGVPPVEPWYLLSWAVCVLGTAMTSIAIGRLEASS